VEEDLNMRRSLIFSLVIFGLAASGVWAQGPPSPPPEQDRGHKKPAKPNKLFKMLVSPAPETMTAKQFIVSSGWFPKDDALSSQDIALDDALKKARNEVTTYLHEQKLAQNWVPQVSFVRDHLLTDLRPNEVVGQDVKGHLNEFLIGERFRAVEETRKVKVGDPEKEAETRRVWLKVVFNPETWKQIQKESRQAEDKRRLEVTWMRMGFLLLFVVSITAILTTICGYIRLDEWSKGYYTKWLRLGAIAAISAVTLVLWSFLHHGRF
jgi:hypothetical protein